MDFMTSITGQMVKAGLIFNFFHIYLPFTANDMETTGVWMHASTDTEVTFFGPKAITCYLGDGKWGPTDGNAILISMNGSSSSGSGIWCNQPSTNEHRYICKCQWFCE